MPETHKPLADCTNFELMELLIPDIMAQIDAADPELLKMIQHRQMTEPGFRPFACFANGFL